MTGQIHILKAKYVPLLAAVLMESTVKRSAASRVGTSTRKMSSGADNNALVSVDFEVFGKVQGVFFRKYTQAKGSALGLRGWCENTSKGTVIGQVQGPRSQVEEMKKWLRSEGSPKSKITQCVLNNEMLIDSFTFTNFSVRR